MSRSLQLFLCLFFSVSAWGQSPVEKGLETINKSTAEAYINFLASDLLEGREAGTQGGYIAGEYIISCFKTIGIKPLFDNYSQSFDAFAGERSQKGRFSVDPYNCDSLKNGIHRKLSLNNILGKIEGNITDEYVIVGAHYDHLGIDPTLANDCIYNGADDNASGVSAVLQIAKAFLATGKKPERTVIFALWDGEEKGLLGSRYFVQSFKEIDKVKAYLNFDMIGRNSRENEPTHVDFFYSEDRPNFKQWSQKDVMKYNLNLTPAHHPMDYQSGGSDNAAFTQVGIPVIWYHTNGHPDFHKPGDHADKLNWDKVVNITKASYLNMWKLANEKEY